MAVFAKGDDAAAAIAAGADIVGAEDLLESIMEGISTTTPPPSSVDIKYSFVCAALVVTRPPPPQPYVYSTTCA